MVHRDMISSIQLTDGDGWLVRVKVGDIVSFKYDIEQSGGVVGVDRQRRVILVRAFEGDYVDSLEGSIIERGAGEFWIDD